MQKTLTTYLPAFFAALAEQRSYALFAPHFEQTVKYLTELSTKKALNKCAEDVLENFNNHVVIKALKTFFEELSQLNINLDVLDANLTILEGTAVTHSTGNCSGNCTVYCLLYNHVNISQS